MADAVETLLNIFWPFLVIFLLLSAFKEAKCSTCDFDVWYAKALRALAGYGLMAPYTLLTILLDSVFLFSSVKAIYCAIILPGYFFGVLQLEK